MKRFTKQDDAIVRRIERLIRSIDFDFSRSTFASFVGWLEQERGRTILLVPWSLPPGISGAWILTSTSDYVFYDKNLPYPLQVQTQLHEFGHMLCGHQPVALGNDSLSDKLPGITSYSIADRLLLRIESHIHSEAEAEAECFASLIGSNYWAECD